MNMFEKVLPSMSRIALSVTRAFPVPRHLFSMGVGVAITPDAVQVAGVRPGKKQGDLPLLHFLDTTKIPNGVFDEEGVLQQHAVLRDILQRMREEHRIDRVHVSLPEDQAYVFRVVLPVTTPTHELRNAVEFHLKENVPFTLEQIVFDYEIVRTRGDEVIVQVVVYPISRASEYYGLFEDAGYTLAGAELHGKSIARACLRNDASVSGVLLLDGGPVAIVTVHEGIVHTSTVLEVRSDDMVTSLMHEHQLSYADAMTMLRRVGVTFDTTPHALTIRRAADVYIDALMKKIAYTKVQAIGGASETDVEPARIHLAGRYAAVKGLSEYIAARLEIPTRTAYTWRNVTFRKRFPISYAESLCYAAPIGLALRDVLY
jgi:type IV pilus assembly protein PilM